MFVPINNGIYTKAHVDKSRNDSYGVLIKETSEIIAVSTGYELDMNHVLYGLVGTFYLSVYRRGITTSGFDNNFIVNI